MSTVDTGSTTYYDPVRQATTTEEHMPTVLTESALSVTESKPAEIPLFDESGELTIAGTVVAEFLETADFSRLFAHPAVRPYVISVVDEDDESIEEEVIPGSIALKVIDEGDLAAMFLGYLDMVGENAMLDGAPLDERAKLAVFENAWLKPLDERFKRGAFRAMRKAEGGARGRNSRVNMMLGAMIAKGEIKRAKSPGGGYKGGDYEKGGRYKTGATKAATQKGKQVSRRMKAKNLRGKMSAGSKRAARRGRALAASVGMEESFIFGHGVPVNGAHFEVDARQDAEIVFNESEFSALKTRFHPCYEAMKPTKVGNGLSFSDEVAEDGAEAEGTNESTFDRFGAAPFANAAGSPSLSEGAEIASSVGRVMGFARKPSKPLTETAK